MEAFSKDQGALFQDQDQDQGVSRSRWHFLGLGEAFIFVCAFYQSHFQLFDSVFFLFFRRPLFNFLFQSTTFQDQDKDFSLSPSSFSTLFD